MDRDTASITTCEAASRSETKNLDFNYLSASAALSTSSAVLHGINLR